MEPHFTCVTVIGAGLLGASIGLGMKTRGMAERVTGVGRRQSSLDAALSKGAVDEVSLDAAAARDADLVILATPSAMVIPRMDEIRHIIRPDALVTDVASTKGAICAHASETWPVPRRFVGSHPMAGSEKFGPEHARADFYENSVCLIEDSPDTDPEAVNRIRAFWEALGARVVPVNPDHHDALLARTSHVPHVLASLLAVLAARMENDIQPFAGKGFRDMTRIAASRPEVWRDICLTNREAITEALREYRSDLGAFLEVLERNSSEELTAFFEEGRNSRSKVVG